MKYRMRKLAHEMFNPTLACSVIAHLRGRLHGNRKRLVYWDLPDTENKRLVAETGGSMVVEWTHLLQDAFVEKAVKELQKAFDDINKETVQEVSVGNLGQG